MYEWLETFLSLSINKYVSTSEQPFSRFDQSNEQGEYLKVDLADSRVLENYLQLRVLFSQYMCPLVRNLFIMFDMTTLNKIVREPADSQAFMWAWYLTFLFIRLDRKTDRRIDGPSNMFIQWQMRGFQQGTDQQG